MSVKTEEAQSGTQRDRTHVPAGKAGGPCSFPSNKQLESQINANHPKTPLTEVLTDLARSATKIENGFRAGGPSDDQIEDLPICCELQQVISKSLCVVFGRDLVSRTYRRRIEGFHHWKSCFSRPIGQRFGGSDSLVHHSSARRSQGAPVAGSGRGVMPQGPTYSRSIRPDS
jgi:hypothetical protein